MRTLLKSLLLIVLSLTLVLGALHFLFGLRIELDGGSTRPMIAWGTEEAQYSALERHRQNQRGGTAEAPEPNPTAPLGNAPASESDAGGTQPETPRSRDAEASTEEASEGAATVDASNAAQERDAGQAEGSAVAEPPALPTPAELVPSSKAWSSYRGGLRTGSYALTDRLAWDQQPPTPIYEQPIGGGYASFVEGGGLMYTIEQRRDEEVVVAYEPRSGIERWATAWPGRFEEAMGGDGPRATPTYADGRVFALGATGELQALDASTGATQWRTNILEQSRAANIQWGQTASPLVVGDQVVVVPGGQGAAVISFDANSGQERWRSLTDRATYAAPSVAQIAGRPQLLIFTATRVLGLDFEGGEPLWEYPWALGNGVNASQPLVIGDDQVFISSGYGKGGALIRIEPRGDGLEAVEVWTTNAMKNRFSTAIEIDGHIYGLDEGILACIDVATGSRQWKAGRYGHGQMLLVGDQILILTEKGDLALLDPNPTELVEVARVPAIRGKTWNNPAIIDGLLVVRNATRMAAFELRGRAK